MKKSMTILILGLAVLSVNAQQQVDLKVVIKKFDHKDGTVKVALFNLAEKWLGDSYQSLSSIIENDQEVIVVFKGIPVGSYAISLYHDENDNGALDTGLFGIPSEDYAFSNNAEGMFGPATYEDSLFTVTETNNQHTINLN